MTLSAIETLTPNLTLCVCEYLEPEGIGSWSRTSSSSLSCLSDESLWKVLFLSRFNHDTSPPHNSTNPAVTAKIPKPPFYKVCYASAHANPHSLWVTHWNIVLPRDGDGNGRICVPDHGDPRTNPIPTWEDLLDDEVTAPPAPNAMGVKDDLAKLLKLCPTCRYHPSYEFGVRHVHSHYDDEIEFDKMLEGFDFSLGYSEWFDGEGLSLNGENCDPVVKAKVVASAQGVGIGCGVEQLKDEGREEARSSPFHALNYSTAKAVRFLKEKYHVDLKEDRRVNPILDYYNGIRAKVRQRAKEALEKGATRKRKVDAEQFRSSGVNFLSDLMFFTAHPSEQRGNNKYGAGSIATYQLYDDRLTATYTRSNLALLSNAPGTISGSIGPKVRRGAEPMEPIFAELPCSLTHLHRERLECTPPTS